MAIEATSNHIFMNFSWQGPRSFQGRSSSGGPKVSVDVINLIFKNTTKDISVDISDIQSTTTFQKLLFKCRQYKENSTSGDKVYFAEEMSHKLLQVSIEQIQNLTLNAGIVEKSANKLSEIKTKDFQIILENSKRKLDTQVKLEIPEKFEIGKTYTLAVTSNDTLTLSARLIKEQSS